MKLKELCSNRFLLFDGAMGTMLQRSGLKIGQVPESFNMKYPEVVLDIHRQYIDAGADIITTNTFGANRLKLKNTPYTVEEVINAGVGIAKKAAAGRLVALDIGPTGQMMEPIGTLSFDDAYDIFSQQVKAGASAGADIILIETISDLYEAKAAVLAARENSDLPIICTMTFSKDGRTLTGTDALTMVQVLEGLGVDGLGLNCSLGPKELQPIVEEVLRYASVPVIVQPNAGLPNMKNGEAFYDLSPDDFAMEIKAMALKGAQVFGGCCGTNPEYIRKIYESLAGLKPKKPEPKNITCACSSTKTVVLGEGVKIIGERINPTGKKRLKEALKTHNLDYILSEAIIQKETGADILDVNVGLPGIDEREMMLRVIKELQSIIDLPLQIDSASIDVLEAAVRQYNGKPIINSVNGKASSMESIFPIAKNYGACVIGLTLDDDGIPKTAQKRFEIAKRIIETAKTYGIPEQNILIDCLVLTASAEQQAVLEALKAIPLIKKEYNVKTVLGVSNVSFGLPERNIINSTYLAMALAYGLDAPIIDPTQQPIMNTIRAFRVLAHQDNGCTDYIQYYRGALPSEECKTKKVDKDLKEIIISGIKEAASVKTSELLQSLGPMEIVDSYLIPALDDVGLRYEKGEIFLPQLIRSAETVKEAFRVIKDRMLNEDGNRISKGKILLATVEGDIHDIGKNIVKILLENYGFEVIDLGKDVPADEIVATVQKENIGLVGLSSLMTTTLCNMEKTIKALKKTNPSVQVMVGGAVLTREYAEKMGADFYGKDANEAVSIAKRSVPGTAR